MKKIYLFITTIVFLFSCTRNADLPPEKHKELGRILNLTTKEESIRSHSAPNDIESEYYGYEAGGKVKWYIGKKYKINGNNYCKSGFGLCKGSGAPYIKKEKPYSSVQQNIIRSANSQDQNTTLIETTIIFYENYIKIKLPYAESNFKEQEFLEDEIFDNDNSLYLDNKLFKSVTVSAGTYKVYADDNGNKYILVKYSINK